MPGTVNKKGIGRDGESDVEGAAMISIGRAGGHNLKELIEWIAWGIWESDAGHGIGLRRRPECKSVRHNVAQAPVALPCLGVPVDTWHRGLLERPVAWDE